MEFFFNSLVGGCSIVRGRDGCQKGNSCSHEPHGFTIRVNIRASVCYPTELRYTNEATCHHSHHIAHEVAPHDLRTRTSHYAYTRHPSADLLSALTWSR